MRGGGGRANRSSRYCMHSADLEEGGSKGAKSVVLAAVCIEKCNVFEVEETLEFFFFCSNPKERVHFSHKLMCYSLITKWQRLNTFKTGCIGCFQYGQTMARHVQLSLWICPAAYPAVLNKDPPNTTMLYLQDPTCRGSHWDVSIKGFKYCSTCR